MGAYSINSRAHHSLGTLGGNECGFYLMLTVRFPTIKFVHLLTYWEQWICLDLVELEIWSPAYLLDPF